MFQYLDDWLINGETLAQTLRNRDLVYQWTIHLGFIVNEEKSDWIPSQRPVFIGACLDLDRGLAFPVEDRIFNIHSLISHVLAQPCVTARTWRALFGHMASLTDLVPDCRLHTRRLQFMVKDQWIQSSQPDTTMIFLSEEGTVELRWWLNGDNLRVGVPFAVRDPKLTIITDASKSGWGGHLGDQAVSGKWSPGQSRKHINWLELPSVFLTLQYLPS